MAPVVLLKVGGRAWLGWYSSLSEAEPGAVGAAGWVVALGGGGFRGGGGSSRTRDCGGGEGGQGSSLLPLGRRGRRTHSSGTGAGDGDGDGDCLEA